MTGSLSLLWNLYQLKRNEKKSREQVRAMQDKKLRKLLRYAYRHSAYYRRTFDEIGITKAQLGTLPLSAFPTMDKATLMAHFDEIVTDRKLKQRELRMFDEKSPIDEKLFMGKYHLVHSSGSTGVPRYFVYDRKAWMQMLAGIVRGALWDMSILEIRRLLSGGLRILYIAATDGRYGGAMAVGDGIHGVGAEQKFLDINTPLAEWVQCMKDFKPDIIIGYPSAIKILGGLVEKEQVKARVCRVICCGEPLAPGLRKYLEQTFQAAVVNFYGASESLALGVETNPADGMILFDDMNVIEVEDGNMYLTCLYNFTQPLIRYRISDKLVLKDETEKDGKSAGKYPFTKANILLSRDEDMLWFEDGRGNQDFLHPLSVEGLCVEGLLDYQFRQTDRDAFEMLAQAENKAARENIQDSILQQMKKILHEKNLDYVRFFVRFVEEIRPDAKTGKKLLITGISGEMGDAV